MALLIDIGNTRIKWARFEDGMLQPQSAAPHADWVAETLVETVLQRGNRADRVPWIAARRVEPEPTAHPLPDCRLPALERPTCPIE